MKNGEYKILSFNFFYSSFKEDGKGDFIRDGKGQTIWTGDSNQEFYNNESGLEVIGWYRLYD